MRVSSINFSCYSESINVNNIHDVGVSPPTYPLKWSFHFSLITLQQTKQCSKKSPLEILRNALLTFEALKVE